MLIKITLIMKSGHVSTNVERVCNCLPASMYKNQLKKQERTRFGTRPFGLKQCVTHRTRMTDV